MPDREEHRALHLHEDEREAHRDAHDHERPRHLAAHDALRDRGHQARLRGRQRGAAEAAGRGVAREVGGVEQVQGEEHDQARDHDADEVAHLHLPRRAAEDVADLQVLQHLAGDGRGDAHHGGHPEHRGHALRALHADDHHGERAPRSWWRG